MGRKRAAPAPRRNRRIRSDSAKIAEETKNTVILSLAERDLVRTVAASRACTLNEFMRRASLTEAIREVVKHLHKRHEHSVVKRDLTQDDAKRAEQIVASAIVEAPTDARLQRLADQLTHLLSADDG